MIAELEMRKAEIQSPIESIYFGGGSPSLMTPQQFQEIHDKIKAIFNLETDYEFTVEVNPDDVSMDYLKELKSLGVNRISLGVQSFDDKELQLMHRVHDTSQSISSITSIASIFENYSVDLIYGVPGSTLKRWELNLS